MTPCKPCKGSQRFCDVWSGTFFQKKVERGKKLFTHQTIGLLRSTERFILTCMFNLTCRFWKFSTAEARKLRIFVQRRTNQGELRLLRYLWAVFRDPSETKIIYYLLKLPIWKGSFWRSANQFYLDKNLDFYFINIKQDCNVLYGGYIYREDLKKQEGYSVMVHERLSESRVTMEWLLAKRNSPPNLPAFLGSYGFRKFCIHYGT